MRVSVQPWHSIGSILVYLLAYTADSTYDTIQYDAM